MPNTKQESWALILGGSSGFGLAAAKRLSRDGFNVCLAHRDRKGSMQRIEAEFDEIRATGAKLISCNLDAVSREGRTTVLDLLTAEAGTSCVRMLLHSIAHGSVRLIAPLPRPEHSPLAGGNTSIEIANDIAARLQLDADCAHSIVNEILSRAPQEATLEPAAVYQDEILLDEEDALATIQAMGISLLSWVQDTFRRGLFASDAQVIGLTSEGNQKSWLGYAAVGAAKAALESIVRSIAVEYGPHGVRANIVQPGVTDTPALRLIPGNARLRSSALQRNPLHRLTSVDDVANVISLLAREDARWINGSLIRVDGGEAIAG